MLGTHYSQLSRGDLQADPIRFTTSPLEPAISTLIIRTPFASLEAWNHSKSPEIVDLPGSSLRPSFIQEVSLLNSG